MEFADMKPRYFRSAVELRRWFESDEARYMIRFTPRKPALVSGSR